jgi:predicted metal-binding membrane protein
MSNASANVSPSSPSRREIDSAQAPHSRASERAPYAVAILVFALATGITLSITHSMSGGGMPMPGHWTMSMMWMTMPGQTWFAAAAIFIGMWLAMMVAMMLPSTLPMLLVYRRACAFRGDPRAGWLTFALGMAYFFVWLLFGIAAYAAGQAVTLAAMRWIAFSRFVPVAAGGALVAAGVFQLTPWKSACLKHCRDPLLLVAHHLHHGWWGAVSLGLHHGAFCAACCWALMLIQLVLGVMNLAVMAVVGVIIALEKLLPRGEMVARLTGLASILGGIWLGAIAIVS